MFESNGWRVKSVRGPIATAAESDEISKLLGFPHPTMLFPGNRVIIERVDGSARIGLDPVAALKQVSKTSQPDIKVPVANDPYWQDKQRSYKLELDYDWTFQTNYHGDISGLAVEPTEASIDFEKLKTGSIQFMDENVLFEDEMGDNGTSTLIVKTRCMEYGIFVLVRNFVRVDHVLFRSCEHRFFIDFDTKRCLMERRVKQESFDHLAARVPRFRDDNLVADQLPVILTETFKLL